MTIRYLNGADFGVAGSYSGVTLPVTGDTVIVPETNNNNIVRGSWAATADLALLYISEGFNKNFCSSGSPLPIAADQIIIKGDGDRYLHADADTASAFKVDEIRVECAKPSNIVRINSNSADAGDIVNVIVNRGTVTLQGDIVWDAASLVEVGYMANLHGDVTLVIEDGNTLAGYEQHGGRATVQPIVTAARLMDGTLIKTLQQATALDIYRGTCHYNHTAISGDGTTIKVKGVGTLDLTQTAVVKTISTGWLFPGATLIRDKTVHTFTTLHDLRPKQ